MTSSESPNFPSLLKHIYPIVKPNQKILLHEGDIDIKQEFDQTTIIARGCGDVYLKWFPYPQVEFNLSGNELIRLRPDIYEVFVKLPDTENFVQAIAPISSGFDQIDGETKEIKQGNVREPLIIGSGQDIKYVQFYLTNFEKFNGSQTPIYDSEAFVGYRATFTAEGWEVILDSVKDLQNHLNLLKAQGGYGITHVGRVASLNQNNFTAEAVLDFLEILSDFLSLVRGIRISPLLLVGYDASDQPVWKVWASSNSEPWQPVHNWAWGLSAEMIAEVFPGFYRWRQSWDEEAKLAIYWYLMTELTKIESSIILGQSALELLAWVHLVQKEEVFTAIQFENNRDYPASKKINCLLENLKIPKSIDSRLNALAQYSNEFNEQFRNNGAFALSKVRNDMVHSSPSNRQRLFSTSSSVLIEAAKLIRWYLELSFLSLSNYQGFYCNCLPQHISWGSRELVPWSPYHSPDQNTDRVGS
jgi:hypothetical protein